MKGLEKDIMDPAVLERAVRRFRDENIRLPRLSQLAKPWTFREELSTALGEVGPDEAHRLNLFRVHWYNDADRKGQCEVPGHLVLPPELTGVEAKIVIALGDRFPMIGAHKVLPAYGCLVPRLITGQFDPARNRAVWPSTGNYCRGGAAISRILDCRAVAVLPEGMSRERFAWLENWVSRPEDIIRTPGSESNVKEIYDACAELAQHPDNIILNQFNEFGNYIVHRTITGPALAHIFKAVNADGKLKARAFIAASGSAGTLAAGDHLKAELGADICAVEALECPTLLYNGYGEHNIQGIGDKHIPFIHNALNTDMVIAVSEAGSDCLNVLFNHDEGRDYLSTRRGLPDETIKALGHLGLSSIANILAAVKYAKYHKLGADDVVLTVATDSADMYVTERDLAMRKYFGNRFDDLAAAETFGRHVLGTATDHTLELGRYDKERIFNLGYYTWVEQQGVSLTDFDRRRDPAFWDGLTDYVPVWDGLIDAFNAATGAG